MSIDPPGAAQPPPPSELQPTNEPLGIASMVTGIVALVLCCCYPVSGFLSVVALSLGIGSLIKVGKNPLSYRGKGFAIAGVATGSIALLLCLGIVLLGVGAQSGKFDQFFPPAMREQLKRQRSGQSPFLPPPRFVEKDGGEEETLDLPDDSAPTEPADEPTGGGQPEPDKSKTP